MAKENYWTNRYNNLPNYIVVGRDMDGITGFTVVHKDNEREYRSGCYGGEITNGLSMSRKEMQEKADKMNKIISLLKGDKNGKKNKQQL